MPSSRYTPSAYGDIDSGGWDDPPPRANSIRKSPHPPYQNPPSRADAPGPWPHDGYHALHGRGPGQVENPPIQKDDWAPAPTRVAPVRIDPPQVNDNDNDKKDDGWGSNPLPSHEQSHVNDDANGWGAPPPAPVHSRSLANGNDHSNSASAPNVQNQQHRSTSRYDDEEDFNEEDEIIPPPSTEPVHGAYVAWTGVT